MPYTYFDARLIGIVAGDSGDELVIEHAGTTLKLPSATSAAHFAEDQGRERGWLRAGQVGYAEPESTRFTSAYPGPSYYFRPYIDQTLRRVVELDAPDPESLAEGRVPNVIGWRCEARPDGFRAPPGLVPGEAGRFIEDRTVSVTLRVPDEFVRECARFGLSPEQMLRGFVGDAAGIQNYVANPRADGYGSNGSDERDMADAWMHRAYEGLMEEAELAEEARWRAEEAEEKRDEFACLLDDYESAGGTADELIATVNAIVDARAAQADLDAAVEDAEAWLEGYDNNTLTEAQLEELHASWASDDTATAPSSVRAMLVRRVETARAKLKGED